MPQQTTLNDFLNKASTAFNVLDTIPFARTMTAPFRIELYKTGAIASAAFAGVGFLGQLIQPREKLWQDLTRNGTNYAMHFALETARGYVEASIGVVTAVVLFCIQLYSRDKFAPYFDYNTSLSRYLFSSEQI